MTPSTGLGLASMITSKFRFWLGLCLLAVGGRTFVQAQEASPPAAAQHVLQHIVIADKLEAAQELATAPLTQLVGIAPKFASLNIGELTNRLGAAENRPIEDRLLAAIAQVVEAFFRQNGFPSATAVIPPQNIAAGVVRVVVSPVNYPLKQIILGDTELLQKPDSVSGTSFLVVSPSLSFFNSADLSKRLESARDRLIDETLLAAIKEVVDTFARQHDLPAAAATIPAQDFSSGIVRLALDLGKIRNIQIQGNRWFSESLLREKLRIQRGEQIRVSDLNQSLTWTNTNPYRRVRMHIEPVPNSAEADLIIGVQDRLPIRLIAAYDNTGNDLLGENRYTAGVSYGNVWGLDHQASYNFSTTDNPKFFRAHSVEYRAPFRWRHVLSATASYVEVNPTFLEGYFTQKGRSLSAELKYVVPFAWRKWQGEANGGITFRQTNNNLEFGGTPVLGEKLDILTANVSAALLREDARGRWVLTTNLVGSPGYLTARSKRQVYENSRYGADPAFIYGQLSAIRLTRLTPTLTSSLRTVYQLASTNLVPSEQLSLGGLATIRGYKERILSGDGGLTLTHELQQRFPSITWSKRHPALDTAGVFFWDYGRATVKKPIPAGPGRASQNKSDYIASVGLGLRASIGSNFSAAVDVGRQLEEIEIPGEPHHRVHVRVSLSY